MIPYPKRLIEVDLPIKRISEHARREKSIRHGHISTLHIWWARRPLAACRAVICAALWPDPADDLCPQPFRDAVARLLPAFAEQVRRSEKLANLCTHASFTRWQRTNEHTWHAADPTSGFDMRYALLDFIADFANWDASTVPAYLETARGLTQAAHEALGGLPGTRPLVVDPFAGGGAIPLEALRVGADAFASDLNPVAVLLNKVVLEYIPKYGSAEITMKNAEGEDVTFHGLAAAVRYWGNWIKEQAERELAPFYPKDPDGATPIAYLWARTITCEGPGCGAEVPLMRSLWLAQKGDKSVALRMVPNSQAKRVDFEIIQNVKTKDVGAGTVQRGAASCPSCGYVTPVNSVRRQLKDRRGGTADARLISVVTSRSTMQGRFYRLARAQDLETVDQAAKELVLRKMRHKLPMGLVPDEYISLNEIRRLTTPIYGMERWEDLFTPRQALLLSSLFGLVQVPVYPVSEMSDAGLTTAIHTCLALAASRQCDYSSSLCSWHVTRETLGHTFTRQALPMVWDFAEVSPFSDSTGDFGGAVQWIAKVLESNALLPNPGSVECASATNHTLPDDSSSALITDPPYYDAVPYAHLSDYFYVWLRRALMNHYPLLLQSPEAPKDEEIVVDRSHELSTSSKNVAFYEDQLTHAFSEGRRVLSPTGIATIVFASKTTASWEAILKAVVDAGWIITGSWPIDTEMEARVAAQGQARLASSIHLVCRPRESTDGALQSNLIGDWREVLQELPVRMHAWLPRLAREGIVGADAIFACLGPALEIFSRYSRVEKASGEVVTLSTYLEYVWAAVSKEALDMVFAGADTAGFEEDARLTAMWLWTLGSDGPTSDFSEKSEVSKGRGSQTSDFFEKSEVSRVVTSTGYTLEYDAARKIAQGLGAHLEQLGHLVEIKGSSARLLPVSERTRTLFGVEGIKQTARTRRAPQMSFFDALPHAEASAAGWTLDEGVVVPPGRTVLDRVHQAMLLFAAGRSDALRRFLVEEGIGQDERFWRLAQALSALYPGQSDEKRWVDGVLARKKGLGF